MYTDKRFLITGAGSGLGRGLTLSFAESGHEVIATDADFDSVAETAALGSQYGGRIIAEELDVTRDDHVARVVSSTSGMPVNVLLNNAGLQHVAPLEEFPQDEWAHLINVMLEGPARMIREVLPGMRAQGYGRIVNIGSIHSLMGSPYKSAYVAAKHGLLGLSKGVALETSDVDITINTICPAYIQTPLVDAQIAAQAVAHGISEDEVIGKIMLEDMPKKAFIGVDEVAAAVCYLIDHLARNVTGQTIIIDGGWTCS